MDNNGFSIQDIMRFANSDAGKQLLSFLQETRHDELDKAMKQAATGDMTKTKEAMQGFLTDPKIRQMLNQIGDQHG